VGAGNEAFEPRRMLGVCLGGAAVVLLVAPDAGLPDPGKTVFVFVALVAPFCYGMEGNYIARFSLPALDPVVTLFGASVIGAAVTAPPALAAGGWVDMPGAFGPSQQAIVALSVLHAAAYAGYVWLIGKAGPVFSSQVAYVVTLCAMVLSALFLNEAYSAYAMVSLALMLTGLTLVRPRRAAAPVPRV